VQQGVEVLVALVQEPARDFETHQSTARRSLHLRAETFRPVRQLWPNLGRLGALWASEPHTNLPVPHQALARSPEAPQFLGIKKLDPLDSYEIQHGHWSRCEDAPELLSTISQSA
jgi:hypothetical protein